MEGLFCSPSVSSHSRSYQFVYVNRRPIYHKSIHAFVDNTYKKINQLLGGSSSSAAASTASAASKHRRSATTSGAAITLSAGGSAASAALSQPSVSQSTDAKAGTGKRSGSPVKRIRSHAVFVLNMTCPPRSYDVAYDPNKVSIEFNNWWVAAFILFDDLDDCFS
jgi:hypothetical protein